MSHRQLKSIQNVFLTVLHKLQIEHNVYSNWYSVDYQWIQRNLLCFWQCKYECIIDNQAFIVCNDRIKLWQPLPRLLQFWCITWNKRKKKVKQLLYNQKNICSQVFKKFEHFSKLWNKLNICQSVECMYCRRQSKKFIFLNE